MIPRRVRVLYVGSSQERDARSRLVPEVVDAVKIMLVVAPSDAADPMGRIAGDTGNRFGS